MKSTVHDSTRRYTCGHLRFENEMEFERAYLSASSVFAATIISGAGL